MRDKSETGEHTIHHQWGETVYWKDGVACGCLEKWTSVEVLVRPHMGVSSFTFFPNERVHLERTIDALTRAFEAGSKAKAKEVCKVLGIERVV